MPGVDAGINGVMLGEILGRKAGEIVAEFVLCRFLPDLMFAFDSTRLKESGDRIEGVIVEVLGVLDALALLDLAKSFGVS